MFPERHPYAKWTGSHWRLVEIADSGLPVAGSRLEQAVDAELAWLLPGLEPRRVPRITGRARRHGSIEGNAVYALSRLGYADHPGTKALVAALIDWQWPDGGWNCDHVQTWRVPPSTNRPPRRWALPTTRRSPGTSRLAGPPSAPPSCCCAAGSSDQPLPGSRSTCPGPSRTTRPTGTTTWCRACGSWPPSVDLGTHAPQMRSISSNDPAVATVGSRAGAGPPSASHLPSTGALEPTTSCSTRSLPQYLPPPTRRLRTNIDDPQHRCRNPSALRTDLTWLELLGLSVLAVTIGGQS